MRANRHPWFLRQDDALLVMVDLQAPFVNAAWERERTVRNAVTLLEAARMLRFPIVPTQQNTARMGATIPEIAKRLPTLCVPFDKMCFSCWEDDAFASEVSRSGRKQIILCGVETHICICQTALDLLTQGYQVQVAADAVSSRTRENWEIGLRRMERAGVLVTSTETAVYELLGEAGTPEFKAMLDLVKAAT